jgi:hypothetical protein
VEASTRELARDVIGRCGIVVGDIVVTDVGVSATIRIDPEIPPVRVDIDLIGLEQYIATVKHRGSTSAVYPGTDPTEAALRLASGNLFEEADAVPEGVVVLDIGINRAGSLWRRVREQSGVARRLPPGDYTWSATKPGQ